MLLTFFCTEGDSDFFKTDLMDIFLKIVHSQSQAAKTNRSRKRAS
jgi:hypothetical protein